VNHLRFFLTDICRSASAEGYLSNNVSEGLKAPSKVVKPAVPKTTVSLEQSEAFALWCGNVAADGICIERSFYKGLYEPPKTAKSDRHVGVPDKMMERLRPWISRLTILASASDIGVYRYESARSL
jgi:hypothetical protein